MLRVQLADYYQSRFFCKPKWYFHDLNGNKNELKEDKRIQRIQLTTKNCKTVEKVRKKLFSTRGTFLS